MLKGNIIAQYILSALTILFFSPLSFFLIGFLRQGEPAGLVSSILFTAFFLSVLIKIFIQIGLLHKINKILSTSDIRSDDVAPKLKRYRKTYIVYFILHVIALTGLVPVLHLLTMLFAVMAGILCSLVYADRQFFFDIKALSSKYPAFSQLRLAPLVTFNVAFYLFSPLLFLALSQGLTQI